MPPMEPMLLRVKVPPLMSSGRSWLAAAAACRRASSWAMAAMLLLCAGGGGREGRGGVRGARGSTHPQDAPGEAPGERRCRGAIWLGSRV